MRKINLIVTGIIFVAAVVLISVFGMRIVVYNGIVPVTKVECINQTNDKVTVEIDSYGKLIRVPFTTPGDEATLSGTMLQLEYRVYPDNATTKKVKYVYNRDLTSVKMITDEKGEELGLLLFSAPCYLTVKIMSTDGSELYDEVAIRVR